MKRIALIVVVSLISGCKPRLLPKDGDIIFHTSRSAQSEAVQRATHSKYSHMGLVLYDHGKPYVFEAVNPVKFTPLENWIKRGEGSHYVLKRLKDSNEVLSSENIQRLHRVARQFEGKPYDLTFEWSDNRIYCSELVWKIYDRALGIKLGQLQRLSDFDLNDPIVKNKLKERYGNRIPFNELVVSPQSIFDSSNLVIAEER